MNWMIVDVPQWDVAESAAWFAEHDGELYDYRGALATLLPGKGVSNRWFCNEALGARSVQGQRTKALRASLWHAGNVGWQIALE